MFAYAAIPHRPRLGNEVEELAYARLLGQQRIALRALVPTGAALVASPPPRLDPDREALRISGEGVAALSDPAANGHVDRLRRPGAADALARMPYEAATRRWAQAAGMCILTERGKHQQVEGEADDHHATENGEGIANRSLQRPSGRAMRRESRDVR